MPVAWKRLIDNRININKNHNVMIKKHYEIPESELLLVKFEEAFLGGTYNSKGIEEGNERDGDDEGFTFE